MRDVVANHEFGIECGSTTVSGGGSGSCVFKTATFGVVVGWEPALNSSEQAKLSVRQFAGQLFLPGKFQGGVIIQQPRMTSEVHYQPTISRDHLLGWVQRMKARSEPSFLDNKALADECVSQMLNTLRRHHTR